MLSINRSQKAFAVGACAGDFNTSIPQRATSSSKPREKVLWRLWSKKLVFSISGQRFPQLLQSPVRRRMFRGIEMNQPSRTDLQCHKYINHAKASGHYGEEITSDDCVGMIFQEGGPALVS